MLQEASLSGMNTVDGTLRGQPLRGQNGEVFAEPLRDTAEP